MKYVTDKLIRNSNSQAQIYIHAGMESLYKKFSTLAKEIKVIKLKYRRDNEF